MSAAAPAVEELFRYEMFDCGDSPFVPP